MQKTSAFIVAGITMVVLAALAAPSWAQMRADVKFEPGTYGAEIDGTIIGDEYFDYRLGAKAGQKLSVQLDLTQTNGDGTVYLNILPPGSTGEAIYNGSMDDNNTETVELPQSGDYTIRVYLMGNDEDAGKTVGYKVKVSIE